MATNLLEYINGFSERWEEVDILLVEAKRHQELNTKLYDAICRSATVLIIAHLEGFIKELVKAIINDLNDNCSFEELPSVIQRTYCRKYLGYDSDSTTKSYNSMAVKLIEKFSELNCKISAEPFFKEKNNNPKPSIIKTVFKNFGIDNVFACLHSSDLDFVFSTTSSELKEYIERQKENLELTLQAFPYSCTQNRLSLDKFSGRMPSRTLWEEFLDEINMKRHNIAHGSDFNNSESVSILETRKDKVFCLQLGLVELLASFIMTKLIDNQ